MRFSIFVVLEFAECIPYCRFHFSILSRISPSSLHEISYVFNDSHSLPTGCPVSSPNLNACRGQITLPPPMIPSASGPSRCGHFACVARNPPARIRKTATNSPRTENSRPSPIGMRSTGPRLIIAGATVDSLRSTVVVCSALVKIFASHRVRDGVWGRPQESRPRSISKWPHCLFYVMRARRAFRRNGQQVDEL